MHKNPHGHDATADSVIERLERLVNQESPSADESAVLAVQRLIAAEFLALGASVRIEGVEAGGYLIVDVVGSKPSAPILMVGHADTVWPLATLESVIPWSRQDGIISGPGVYDMKSGIVVMIESLRRIRKQQLNFPSLRIFIAPDEEVGSPASRDALVAAAAGCSAVLGFESPHPDGALKVGRWGSVRCLVEVTGREAHAALDPEKGISATDELVDVLLRIRAYVQDRERTSPGRILLNVGALTGDGQANVVNAQASALLGLRFADLDAETSTLSFLRDLVPERPGATIRTQTLSHRPAWAPRVQDARLALEIDPSQTGRPAKGAADTNLLASLDLSIVDGLGPRGGGAHAITEHIVEIDLFNRIELVVRFLTGR